ncbi:hypothetical protein [Horticoccus sp. 23ND18S-11]|uniref:hypothetical protein n=1 Tax=Horticoccus sp. 23ND18S-11 TaxID=3391832 RepID=UPI0039C9C386
METSFAITTFSADVTVPLGHGMMGGYWKATSVADPLYAKGVVLWGGGQPVVFVAVDWCEIRNDAYDRWRDVIAAAAGTTRERVLVSSIHQHEAPVADLTAQRFLAERGLDDGVCDLAFHETAVQRVAAAVRAALNRKRPVTHLGLGQAKVAQVASNRRYLLPDGRPSFNRGSASAANVLAREAPEGVIDPWLKTLSFWHDGQPVAALSAYAVHPMSYYRTGEISADFPGIARARRQQETPDCLQIYLSGASGNVTAGKYNDGARATRAVLADRLHAAMVEAWRETKQVPLASVAFRHTAVRLAPRDEPGLRPEALLAKLVPERLPRERNLAAMGLSWRKRVDAGQPIDVPLIDFGAAQLLLLPGESYVEFQLAAQRMNPGSFVLVAGFGESATGYVPTEQAVTEQDTNLADWCWVAPGAEAALLAAIQRVVQP